MPTPESDSVFEFLDDDAPAAPPPPFVPYGTALPPEVKDAPAALPLPPVQPRNAWEAMDADYRQPPEPPTAVAWRDLFRRHPTPLAVAARSRLEFPVLLTWIFCTTMFSGFVPWLIGGLGMIAFSFYMRRTFAMWRLQGQAGVYRAVGIAELGVALASVVSLGSLTNLLVLYMAAVLASWIFVESRYLYRLEQQELKNRRWVVW